MRKNLVALCIVAIILGMGIYEHFYLDKVFTELEEKSQTISEYIENDKMDIAINFIEETQDWWEDKIQLIEVFSYNCDFKYVQIYLAEIEGGLKSNNTEIALSRSYALSHTAKELKNNTGFFVVNIF